MNTYDKQTIFYFNWGQNQIDNSNRIKYIYTSYHLSLSTNTSNTQKFASFISFPPKENIGFHKQSQDHNAKKRFLFYFTLFPFKTTFSYTHTLNRHHIQHTTLFPLFIFLSTRNEYRATFMQCVWWSPFILDLCCIRMKMNCMTENSIIWITRTCTSFMIGI